MESEPAAEQIAPIPPARRGTWGFIDILAFLAFAIGSLLVLQICAGLAFRVLKPLFGWEGGLLDAPQGLYIGLIVQVLWWLTALGFLYFTVTLKYGLDFRDALAWRSFQAPVLNFVSLGILLALCVGLLSLGIPQPDENPFEEMLKAKSGIVMLAVFAVVLAPPLEELLFRGFLYAPVRRVLGAAGAVALTGALFASAHLMMFNGHWPILAPYLVVGVTLGLVRWKTGSTLASTIVHAAYNATLFAGLLAAPEQVEKL